MGRKVGLTLFVVAVAGGSWFFSSRDSSGPESAGTLHATAPATPKPTSSPPSPPLVPPTQEPKPAPPAPAEPERPESEEDFLRQLQSLHWTDKAAALKLARQGEDWYSEEGPAAEARKAMIATLLVDLGRMNEARAEVRRFIERYPDSPYRPMLQGKTGIHPRPGAPDSHRP